MSAFLKLISFILGPNQAKMQRVFVLPADFESGDLKQKDFFVFRQCSAFAAPRIRQTFRKPVFKNARIFQ